jgi:serine/threonine protein kinase
MPLTTGGDYGRFDFSTVSWKDMLSMHFQTLQGLSTLHGAAYMHCNIKPGHLLVLSTVPPVAAICDFGLVARQNTTARETRPVHASPPETWAMHTFIEGGYTARSDVWSLAYSWLWAMAPRTTRVSGWDVMDFGHLVERPGYDGHGAPFKFAFGVSRFQDLGGIVTPPRHAVIIESVDVILPAALDTADADGRRDVIDDMIALFKRMLARDPAERPSAQEALEAPVWDVLAPWIEMGRSNAPSPSSSLGRVIRQIESSQTPSQAGGSPGQWQE